MPEFSKHLAEWAAMFTESIGVIIITSFSLWAILYAAFLLVKRESPRAVFQTTRQRLGRGILLGLEFLVAADIIHTVAVELTFQTVGVLAVVVVIRTFLSFTLDVELSGKWPWQKDPGKGAANDSR